MLILLITEGAQVIKTGNMIHMFVRDEHKVNMVYARPQGLQAELWSGIYDDG
jgi:hypothetical protein